MKKFTSYSAVLMAIIAFAGLAFTVKPGSTLKVDTLNSNVQWVGHKVTGQHSGVVNIKSGTLTYNEKGFFSGGSFEIDMTSISPGP